MKEMLHTKALVVKDSVGASEVGVIDSVIGSTACLDRMGDIIDQAGWDLKSYNDNPVILWGHNMGFGEDRPPIAKAIKVWVQDKGTKTAALMFRIKFDLADEFAADIYRKVKEGFINTVSVGFLPTEWEELEPGNFWGGLKYTAQQLLELSFVCVPANPQALVGLRSFAKDDKRFTPIDETKLFRPLVSKKALKEIFHLTDDELKEIKDGKQKMETINIDDTQGMDEEGNVTTGGGKENNDGQEESTDEGTYTNDTPLAEITADNFVHMMGEVMDACTPDNMKTIKADTADQMPDATMCVKDMNVGHMKALMADTMGDWMSNLSTTSNQDDVNEYAFSEADTKEQKIIKAKALATFIQKAGRVLSNKNESKIRQAMDNLSEVLNELDKEETQDEASKETPKGNIEGKNKDLAKGVIAYKDTGKAPESEAWDGAGEVSKASIEDLKVMCTWYDDTKADDKTSYKLPHHKADGEHIAVWRAVASSMAALMGSRGGLDIPEEDRKGVYNHLAKHYKEFDKEVPDFKMVEEQIMKGLEQEIHAITLDREEKHVARLIKKVLENQKVAKKEKPKYDEASIELKVLQLFDKTLTKVGSKIGEGGGK